jgi:hypothetical protein
MIVAPTFSATPDTALINMAVANRNRSGATNLHADHGPIHIVELR